MMMQPLSIVTAGDLSEDQIELVEKLSLRLVYQAFAQFSEDARQIFTQAQDREIEIAQDITREALDAFGGFPIRQRVFGTMDYKGARWLPTNSGLVPQALFVDSKAEKDERSCTLQMSQVSLPVRFRPRGSQSVVAEQGSLPEDYELNISGQSIKGITTVIIAHYYYAKVFSTGRVLQNIRLAALPNRRLAHIYCPTETDHIWMVGRNAPSRGERFRVRVSFQALQLKAVWRVQLIDFRSGQTIAVWQDYAPDGSIMREHVPPTPPVLPD